MCECIDRIEKMLNEKLIERHPEVEIIEPVELQNKALMLGTGRCSVFSNAIGRYMDGKRKRKFDVNMYYTYCPFCGKKQDED